MISHVSASELVLAHEKWFVEPAARFPTNWSFAVDPATIALLGVAVLLVVLWRLVARRVAVPELAFLSPLARLGPWIPRLLGIHLGVSLLGLAVTNSYLSPHLGLTDVPGGPAVAFAEGAVGAWLITGIALRPAGAAVVALGPVALFFAGPVSMVEAADVLGLALFLAVLPPGRDNYGERRPDSVSVRNATLLLRLGVGAALIAVAFSEKLANPALAMRFLDSYPAFNILQTLGLEVSDLAFIRIAGAIEVAFGLLILSGAMPQLMVIVVGIPFNATLFFLGRDELIGHLPIYGAMLALLVYGSDRLSAMDVGALTPSLSRGWLHERPVRRRGELIAGPHRPG